MKALKDYGIKSNDLKTAVKGLNSTGFLGEKLKVVGVKGEEILVQFMDAVDGLSDDQVTSLPKDVGGFYDNLPQSAFDDAPSGNTKGKDTDAKAGAEAGAGTEPECPTFADHNPEEDDCKACVTDYPEEHKACVEATSKKAKAKDAKATPKSKAKKSRYGHLLNSMAGDIDDLVHIGCHIDKMTKVIAKKHDRTEDKARAKIRAHVGYLAKTRGLKVHEEEGVLHIKVAYLKGFNKSNTEVVFSEVPKTVKKKGAAAKK